MTSLSQYASRFLSSGQPSSARPGVDDDADGSDPSDPLFYNHASGAPFSNPYGPDYSMTSSDGLPSTRTPTQAGGSVLHSLTGASRFGPASFMATAKPRNNAMAAVRDSMIREIDDEDDVDLWRDDRRMPALASRMAESTLSDQLDDSSDNLDPVIHTQSHAAGHSAQDPFLADHDLERDDTKSNTAANVPSFRSSPYAQRKVSPHFTAAKAKGWLAHGSTTISSSNIASADKKKGRSAGKQRAISNNEPAGHSNMGASSSSSAAHRSSLLYGHRARESRATQSRTEDLYSIYDEQEQDADERSVTSRSRSSSVSASSVTDTDSDSDRNRSRRASKASGKANRSSQAGRNRARDMISTLREPLLPTGARRVDVSGGVQDSSSGSETEASDSESSPRRSSRKREHDTMNDVFVYPSPPARSGWGPWANRLAFGKYRDKTAMATFAAVVGATMIIGLYTSWNVSSPAPPVTPKTRPSSYYTITRSLPILILLTLLSFGASIGNLLLLRNLGKLGGAKVLRTGLMGVPVILGLGWTWAFAGSFIYDDESWSGGAWSTTGLRLVSIIPLALAAMFTRMVWTRRKALSRSIAVLELSCSVVLQHPALLVLAAASLGVFILITIPFVYLFTRLFLVGHFGRPVGDSTEWRTDAKAALLAWTTLLAWLWTWAVLRGIQRVTVAGVISHWYFNRITNNAEADTADNEQLGDANSAGPSAAPSADKRRADEDGHYNDIYGDDDDSIYGDSTPNAPGAFQQPNPARRPIRQAAAPDPTEVVRASFSRATGPALGSVCLAALILACIRTLTVMAELARRVSNATTHRHVPRLLQPLTHLVAVLAGLSAVLKGYSDLALVYVGVTGDGFGTAAKKSAQLVARRGVKGVLDGLIIKLVLDLTIVALSFLAGLAGFLFSAHQLHVPADAPLVGLLCALLPYWTLRLCADVLTNAADTLYLCYAIDHASNDQHCPKAASAFTAENNANDGSDSILPF